jgi:hypothetical protein
MVGVMIEQIDDIVARLDGLRDRQNTALWLAAVIAGGYARKSGVRDLSDPLVQEITERLFAAAMAFPVMDQDRPWDDKNGQRQARSTIKSGLKKGLLR